MQQPDTCVHLRSRRLEANDLIALEFDLSGTQLAHTHAIPGQFVMLALEGHAPMPFAIASPPGSSHFELLLKRQSPLAQAIAQLPIGSPVMISPALGTGFPVSSHPNKDLLLFAVGSGISAIRSLVLYLIANREHYGEIRLFYGVRSPANLAYQNEYANWQAHGIQVSLTISDGSSDWKGSRGYVQELLKHHLIPDPARTTAFVCGMPEMITSVTASLSQLGLPQSSVLTNY